ncbi:MAG: helix-turn-helix transcriptional regulator, partial [Daejeonella sp.]|uniref:helix-turn-helix domain-containing protein n=1 Tax=Daejeonella sp. TaxID=2805397 RepID=UPI003C72DDA2
NLRRIRVSRGISQEWISNKLDISQTKYSLIERGKILPDAIFISLAAGCLEVTPKELMPAGWDQLKPVKIVNTLTRTGLILYRVLLAVFAYDIARGFCNGNDIVSEPGQVAVLLFVGAIAVMVHCYTESQVVVDR